MSVLTGAREGAPLGLRSTKIGEDAKWGGPPGPRGSPWTRSLALDHISSWPTWASAADQGVRPTWRNGVKPKLRKTPRGADSCRRLEARGSAGRDESRPSRQDCLRHKGALPRACG